jgi:quinol monooxygenase YgiN
MRRSIYLSAAAAAALVAAAAIVLPLSSRHSAAQSAAPYINAVDLDIVPAALERYKAAITENAAATVKEPGCRQFDILVLASNPNHVFLYEVYDSEVAFQAHRASEHFKKYAGITAEMVAKRESRPMTPIAFNAKAH